MKRRMCPANNFDEVVDVADKNLGRKCVVRNFVRKPKEVFVFDIPTFLLCLT